MDATVDMDTPAKLAAKATYLRGPKRGKRPSPRAIQYALARGPDVVAPTLDLVEALAEALGRRPWELVTDTAAERRVIVERLVAPPQTVPDGVLKGGPFDASGKMTQDEPTEEDE